jgi:hypothetical protein
MSIDLAAANISQGQRDKFQSQGVTMGDGSFPIPSVLYLRKAIQSYGRCPPDKRQALVAHIKKRADALHADGLVWVKNFLAAHGGDPMDGIPAKKGMGS